MNDLRILLWDIDGTLIRSVRMGAYKDYTIPVLETVFGTAGRLADMQVSGMTDLQIVSEALRDEGFTAAQINERLHDLRDRYIVEMERVIGTDSSHFYTLPGVPEVLEATSNHSRYRNALLTGNMEAAAHLKMRAVGLSQYFQLPGAYGDESHDRRDLPALAFERINRALELDLKPSQFIVIGDTPNDIACAHHCGARALAVATGRMNPADVLIKYKPDALLSDLSDTDLVMRTLEGI